MDQCTRHSAVKMDVVCIVQFGKPNLMMIAEGSRERRSEEEHRRLN
jgi:hypothetical protein